MKASELIAELANIIAEQGDLEVKYAAYDTFYRIQAVRLTEQPGQLQLPLITIE